MTKRWTWMALLLLAMVAMWGCSDDDPVTPTQTAFEVMAEAGADYINDSADAPGVISAEALFTNGIENYTIIDLRSEATFLNGHIEGAMNSSLGTLLADVAAKSIALDDQIVVACYSGQSAGHAKIALELMGYENVQSLLFGMASWNTDFAGSWTNNTGDAMPVADDVNHNVDLLTHTLPTLSESVDTVVAERVATMLAAGFKGITYTDMVANGLTNYFIVNYFGEADYMGTGTAGVPGHIEGAFQFTPYASMGIDQMLDNLPVDMPIVVYCWTGQHSSQITAYLNMLGYNAFSLKFGSNSLFHSQLTGHKWNEATASHDYAVELGSTPSQDFTDMQVAGIDYVNDNTDCPGVINADDLFNNGVTNYKIFDIRAASAFDAGHIEGAMNSSLGTLLVDVAANATTTDAIVVACYTGQSAGHAKIALELMGYENVKSLLWGMSSWNTTLAGSWNSNCFDNLAVVSTVNENDGMTGQAYPMPTGTVEERVAAMLAEGFKGISYTDLVNNGTENYFIINYFGEADYMGTGGAGVPGHIEGAYQFTPYASFDMDELLVNVPSDMPVVVYCWTGQHSSQITAYLNMMGYEAYSLKFGSNGLFHTALTGHKWTEAAQSNAYPLFTD